MIFLLSKDALLSSALVDDEAVRISYGLPLGLVDRKDGGFPEIRFQGRRYTASVSGSIILSLLSSIRIFSIVVIIISWLHFTWLTGKSFTISGKKHCLKKSL